MVLPFGMSMLGGGSIAPVRYCSTVSVTKSRYDLCAGAGSRVQCDYMYTIIRPYAMHCAMDRGRRMGVASVYYATVKAVLTSVNCQKAVCKLVRTLSNGKVSNSCHYARL